MIDEQGVRAALAGVQDPHADVSLADAGFVRGVGVDGGKVAVELALGYPAAGWHEALKAKVREAVGALPGVEQVAVNIATRIVAHQVQDKLSPLPGVKNIIAVASGKGGVGKSTTSVNLALALQAEGARVGVLDADIYGPSVPRMLGISGKPDTTADQRILPKLAHGLQAMSIGLLIDEDTPMIWRGPMVTQAMQQLLTETLWDELDYLIIDLPPGTGDIQLTLCQKVPVSAAVIVTTPQDIALLDAKKALKMFEKVSVPVLGIVENMAVHVCSNCGHAEHVFGSGGGERMAAQYGVPLLGSLPLDIGIRELADSGRPSVADDPESPVSRSYRDIARHAAGRLSQRARNKVMAFPNIVVQNS
ncbi:MAG: iron-sulfur cluster carrier protein ApbC [Rhodanobacteraceae bacterium]|nr:iron-sulfur cluster carrier protein ApbC [Xanthomonadales bacterium]MCP5479116.1 iron-sulfur cluster carrier protein ApbC [Rhodanobacteraceae bacterium]HPF72297.1 iron-sulfur cluster carrier protein ApbC [Xanthomonadaceae bacterium]HRX98562.1 iron-sulfur cluster carrier protein ApbC [Xanthomonadaceae bacterium]